MLGLQGKAWYLRMPGLSPMYDSVEEISLPPATDDMSSASKKPMSRPRIQLGDATAGFSCARRERAR